ncbi:hypothetical protein SLS56_011870 [Neofusicoccum ribis]|uniref:Uncharacterized protein n=1 Tax=Neofusicoccum ribis TaxID=45134 RepID=A0ABR3SAF2_9PEZI
MARKKLREWLMTPSPKLTTVTPGSTTKTVTGTQDTTWPRVPSWSTWTDFNHASITKFLHKILEAEYELPASPPRLPAAQCAITDERTYEFALIKFHNQVVSEALDAVGRRFPLLGAKLRCWACGHHARHNDIIGKPDWAAIPATPPPDFSTSLPDFVCPGDSKYRFENFPPAAPQFSSTAVAQDNRRAQVYLRQAAHYAVQRRTRYFYLLTPCNLMVCRRRASGGNHLSANEPVRPEIVVLPYSSDPATDDVSNQLSINVALFAMHVLASLSHEVRPHYTSIENEYGPLLLQHLGM